MEPVRDNVLKVVDAALIADYGHGAVLSVKFNKNAEIDGKYAAFALDYEQLVSIGRVIAGIEAEDIAHRIGLGGSKILQPTTVQKRIFSQVPRKLRRRM
jgi:hypothetical protein